jgi:ribosomal protein S3
LLEEDEMTAVETEQGVLGVEIWARDATRAHDEQNDGRQEEGGEEEEKEEIR